MKKVALFVAASAGMNVSAAVSLAFTPAWPVAFVHLAIAVLLSEFAVWLVEGKKPAAPEQTE